MLGPNARKIRTLRERVEELSAIHASLGHPIGWANCECALAKLLRLRSDEIGGLLDKQKSNRRAK